MVVFFRSAAAGSCVGLSLSLSLSLSHTHTHSASVSRCMSFLLDSQTFRFNNHRFSHFKHKNSSFLFIFCFSFSLFAALILLWCEVCDLFVVWFFWGFEDYPLPLLAKQAIPTLGIGFSYLGFVWFCSNH